MTNAGEETALDMGIDDDQLPQDLQPEENPLAQSLEPGDTAGDLLQEGKGADQSEGSESTEREG